MPARRHSPNDDPDDPAEGRPARPGPGGFVAEDDPRVLRALLGVRLASWGDTAAVARAGGLSPDDARAALGECVAAGWVRRRGTARSGWSLTPAGRATGAGLLAAELDGRSQRRRVTEAYVRFRDLNGPVLAVCRDWQLRSDRDPPVANAHDDATYDDAVRRRLAELEERRGPVTRALAEALDRFAGYDERLSLARDRVDAGDPDWLDKPSIDSYHTVWFELHENLLATLGIERADEGR